MVQPPTAHGEHCRLTDIQKVILFMPIIQRLRYLHIQVLVPPLLFLIVLLQSANRHSPIVATLHPQQLAVVSIEQKNLHSRIALVQSLLLFQATLPISKTKHLMVAVVCMKLFPQLFFLLRLAKKYFQLQLYLKFLVAVQTIIILLHLVGLNILWEQKECVM